MAEIRYVCMCNTCYKYLERDELIWDGSALLTYRTAMNHRKVQLKSNQPFRFGVLDLLNNPVCMVQSIAKDLLEKPMIASLMDRARHGPRARIASEDPIGDANGGVSAPAADEANVGASVAVSEAVECDVMGAVISALIGAGTGGDIAMAVMCVIGAASGATQLLEQATPTSQSVPIANAIPLVAGVHAGPSSNNGVPTSTFTTPLSAPRTPRNLFPAPHNPLTPASLRPILNDEAIRNEDVEALIPGDGEEVLVDVEDEEEVIPWGDLNVEGAIPMFDADDAEEEPLADVDEEEEASKKRLPGIYIILITHV
jgi:hypothetical protein